jgi:hypothetical protein
MVYAVCFPRCTTKKETETVDTNGTEAGFAVSQKMRTANGSYNKIKNYPLPHRWPHPSRMLPSPL